MMLGAFYFDWTILLILPALFISIWAQVKVSSTFKKCSQVFTRNGVTGYQAARRILDANGLSYVRIERVRGHLTDHFDPRQYLGDARAMMKEIVKHKIVNVLGSAGKAF